MTIDPRLDEIDDCLYRVAIRALIVIDDKVLIVKESDSEWWAFPGGGVDHGETVESTLVREVEEELGVPVKDVSSDFQIVYYSIGSVVNGVPRMNLFFKVSVPEELITTTDDVAEWGWFTKAEFMELDLNSSYDKSELVGVIFGPNG
jgi:8-oxo-dGTP diphosphatase